MAYFYLDTSALVKRYRTERGTELLAQLLINPPPEDRFYISFLSVLELTSGVMRLVKGGQLRQSVADAILAGFRQDISETFRVWPLNEDMASAAVSVAERHRLRSGDAIHLATALATSAAAPGAIFIIISADRELLEAAASAGLATLNPEEVGAPQALTRIRDRR